LKVSLGLLFEISNILSLVWVPRELIYQKGKKKIKYRLT